LSVIIEHVFGGNVGNLEVLQSNNDGSSNVLGVVGVDSFELIHKSFDLLVRSSVVTGHNTEMLDIGFFVIRKFNLVGVGGCESVVPTFVERWVVSSSRCLTDFSG
jgi:hypothetical protein